MDIGTEISKKIQLAIKAKLTELDAYVDDELPDYIMIMIANRKPREQMTEALSLFLSDDTKIFTKWLYDLLESLQGKEEKQEAKQTAKVEGHQSSTNKVKNAQVEKKSDKNDSKSDTVSDKPKSVNSKSAPVKTKLEKSRKSTSEDVIDILPDMDDFFDMELMGNDNTQAKVQKEVTNKNDRKLDVKVSQNKMESEKSQVQKKETVAKRDQSSERKKIDMPKAKPLATSPKGKVSRKTVVVKTSVTNSSKHRKQLAAEKSSYSGSKETSRPVRDWDHGKHDRQDQQDQEAFSSKSEDKFSKRKLNRKIKYTAPVDSESEDEEISSRAASSVVSIVSAVKGAPEYVSEDESEEEDKSRGSTVISAVAVPAKRPRLPSNKQANKFLLLKAVSEAENSIRQSRLQRGMKSKNNSVTKTEKQLVTLAKNNIASRIGSRIKEQPNNERPSVSRNAHRKSSNLTDTTERPKKRKGGGNDTAAKSAVYQKVAKQTEVIKTDQNTPEIQQHTGDSRLIVKREKLKEPEPKKSTRLVPKSSNETGSVQFDSRMLSLKNGSTSPKSGTSKVNKSKRAKRSPSPRFIVTLDGTGNTKDSQQNKEATVLLPKKKPFKKVPVQAPDSTSCETDANASVTSSSNVVLPVQKPLVISMSSSNDQEPDNVESSDQELMNMRVKLLKMQEEAKKLKILQTEQLALLERTASLKTAENKPIGTAENSDEKSIHIANVHFSSTEKQLSEHFSICGKVVRATILKDAFTGHPKGFAYLQFEEASSVDMALAFDGTTFCSRAIKVTKKSNEAVAKTAPAARPRYRASYQFPAPRFPSRPYTTRYNTTSYRSRGRAMVTRNKKWVKPGLLPA
ncbi:uncharacterized protein LOC100181905 [Ciona intestinalis]